VGVDLEQNWLKKSVLMSAGLSSFFPFSVSKLFFLMLLRVDSLVNPLIVKSHFS
jgi:hypothetical protein